MTLSQSAFSNIGSSSSVHFPDHASKQHRDEDGPVQEDRSDSDDDDENVDLQGMIASEVSDFLQKRETFE